MLTVILTGIFFGTGGWFLGYIFPNSTIDALRGNITFSVLGAVFGSFIGFILAERLFRSVSHRYTTMGKNYLSPICICKLSNPIVKDIYLVRNSNGNIEYSYGGELRKVEKKDILSVTIQKGDAPYFEVRPIKWVGWDLFTMEPMSERSPISFVISEEAMILDGKVEVETTRQVKIVSS